MSQVRPVDEIAAISPRALLLVHGEQDDFVLADNARQLYAAARDPKELYLIPKAGHEDFVGLDAAYPQKIIDFFNRYLLEK
jgi:fermentation-respiration switch protein FrsA (DUF1100 family)